MAKVMVGSTIPAYKTSHPGECAAWLTDAPTLAGHTRRRGHDLYWFATLEVDARGIEPFTQHVTSRLHELDAAWWTFSIDLGDPHITSQTRLPRICAGRNLLIDRALHDPDTTHLLFVDSDTHIPPGSITRLVDLDRPLAGGHVPVYCLDGPPVPGYRNVREHWNTAGFLMAQRQVIRHLRWGIDPDQGITDDPWFARAAFAAGFGRTWVDHDLVARHRPHTPGPLGPVESRGHDLKVYR